MKRLMGFVVVIVGMFAGVAGADIPSTERDVLVALYNSTGSAGWAVQTNWNGAPGTECTWYGVTCDSGSAHVIGIDLRNNNLVGTIPSLTGLTALQAFDVSSYFGLHFNQLTGSIPSLAGLMALREFDVHNNSLTGNDPVTHWIDGPAVFQHLFHPTDGNDPAAHGIDGPAVFRLLRQPTGGNDPRARWIVGPAVHHHL